jgi:hypothetical protein
VVEQQEEHTVEAEAAQVVIENHLEQHLVVIQDHH